MEGLETSDEDQRGENETHEDKEAATMSGRPVGDELEREHKQQQEEEGGVEEEKKLSSPSEEEQLLDGEGDQLLKKEKSFIFERRIMDADLLKMRGNELLGNGFLKEAETNYRRGLYHVDMDPLQENLELQDEHLSVLYEARQPLKLNLCRCILRQDMNRASEALKLADEVIKKNGECAKAWFWRGKAKLEMGKLSGAKEDLLKAAKLAPQDGQVRSVLQIIKEKIHEEDLQTRPMWKGLFQSSDPSVASSSSAPPSLNMLKSVWSPQSFIIVAICVVWAAIHTARISKD